MTGREVFKIWAPVGAKWVDWVRPVPFIAIDNDNIKTYNPREFEVSNINYISKLNDNIAIIVDLPGYDSIKEGIGLSQLGFRPIPIYNGTNEQDGAMPTVDNHVIEPALIWGASKLEEIQLNNNALPVFLLDSNRMHRFKMNESIFDNSWDIYDQDIPTAEYFLKNGINKIIVRGDIIQKDLAKILYKFQKKGMKIFFTNGYEEPKEVKLKKSCIRKND